ncbi:hypothetical protein CLJ1_2925 [Pseudomonas paraeruginosa]|nr:hypothetical protein CLJ1_2925 [Pseudomonas aeruginosa]
MRILLQSYDPSELVSEQPPGELNLLPAKVGEPLVSGE